MIRFCDKEVCCVIEGAFNRQQLITYFFDGHRNELICILDENGKYVGKITYDSLLGKDIKDSINRDYLILDKNIWKNGRKYFGRYQKNFGGVELLPVLNKEHQLLCFAWQDDEANRELRMLDELMECTNALNFKDVYPEWDCVIVDGCNELACCLVQYLRKIGVSVNVSGEMWPVIGIEGIFDIKPEEETLDYRRFTVYSEGIVSKAEKVEQRRSVSVEFECIDKIYEENIRRGIIGDTVGDFHHMLESIKGKQIAIIGTSEDSLNAYDLFLEYGIDINCFISEKEDCQEKKLFEKSILRRVEAEKYIKDLVFVEAASKYSAWGFGETDDYHYLGYKRNEKYFLLQDYTEISKRGLPNVLNSVMELSERKLILAGDVWLCLQLCKTLEIQNRSMQGRIVYFDVLEEYTEEKKKLIQINADEINETDICILLLPECYGCFNTNDGHISFVNSTVRERYLKIIEKNNIQNVADASLEKIFFINNVAFSEINANSKLRVKKIILGSINSYSGNIFFRSILDNHPEIVMLGYSYLNNNLFFICIRLAMEKGDNILSLFWKLCSENQTCESNEWEDDKKAKFNQSMKEMLAEKDEFTSQELFVMIHISYAKMLGKEVENLSNLVIYWEPHIVPRTILEDYAIWLTEICDAGYIINVVRDACIRAGSGLKDIDKKQKRFSGSGKDVFREILACKNIEKKYNEWRRLIFRFEDLKLRPQKELESFCDELEISWSDTLLETTINGKQSYYGKITGFDLTPVYRTYEKYFSSFDRFRISLITATWQKKYGYPYVSSLEFGRRELQEMFTKKFRFEEKLKFSNEEEELEFERWKWNILSGSLWMNRRMEICEESVRSC